MATSKKDPPNPNKGRMSPSLRPSSNESSGYGYGARRARSVPSSPDRKFGSSSPSMAPSGSIDVKRPSLSSAGRSISSRIIGSSIHGSKAQPLPSTSSKPTLARVKSDKVSTTSQRPSVLVPPSNSFKDMNKTAAKASPSTLLRSKPSPRPSADSCKAAASPKPSSQRVMMSSAARGDKVEPLSTTYSPGVTTKKRLDTVNGATTSSKPKSVSQKAMGASASRKEKLKDPSMQVKETECINTTSSIEEHLHMELSAPADLESMEMTVPDLDGPSSSQPEQVFKDDEESKVSEEKEDAGATEIHNGGQDANGGVKTIYECGIVEKGEADQSADKAVSAVPRTEVAQVSRKDDPKGNDVIEETKSKLLEERKSRVRALVGAFENVLSFKE